MSGYGEDGGYPLGSPVSYRAWSSLCGDWVWRHGWIVGRCLSAALVVVQDAEHRSITLARDVRSGVRTRSGAWIDLWQWYDDRAFLWRTCGRSWDAALRLANGYRVRLVGAR